VDGADTKVLFGCETLLKREQIHTIYYEQNRQKLEVFGAEAEDAKDFL
jgi:hypothetical protein